MALASTSHPHAPTHLPVHGKLRVYARSVTDVFLLLTWVPAAFSGIILWDTLGIVPAGPGKGEREMLWSLTTSQWGEIHWWVSAAALAFTLVHIALDWKMFKGAMRYLFHRHPMPEGQ
ncbi:MAG: DUF4405 domain-containing protein [Dehalococcoidia bacterium]